MSSEKKEIDIVQGSAFIAHFFNKDNKRISFENELCVQHFKLYTDNGFKCYMNFSCISSLIDPLDILSIQKISIIFINNSGKHFGSYNFDTQCVELEGEGSYGVSKVFSFDAVFTINLNTFKTNKTNETQKK